VDDFRVEVGEISWEHLRHLVDGGTARLDAEWKQVRDRAEHAGNCEGAIKMGDALMAAIHSCRPQQMSVISLLQGLMNVFMTMPQELDRRCAGALMGMLPEVCGIMNRIAVKEVPDMPANGMGEALVDELMKPLNSGNINQMPNPHRSP
jgi:hypothetical protein